MSIALPPITLMAGIGQTIQLLNPNQIRAIVLSNKSVFDLQVSGLDASGIRWITAGTEYMLPASNTLGTLSITPINTAQINPSPTAICLITEYLLDEPLPSGQWPVSIPTQIVQTNTVTAISNVLVNDISPVNSSIVEATQTGAPASNVAIDNSGNLTIAEYVAGVRIVIFQLIAGGATVLKLAAISRLTQILGNLQVDGTSQLQNVFVNNGLTVNSNKIFGSGGNVIFDWSASSNLNIASPGSNIVFANGAVANSGLTINNGLTVNSNKIFGSGGTVNFDWSTSAIMRISSSGGIALTNGTSVTGGDFTISSGRLTFHDGSHVFEMHGFSGTGNGTFSHGCSTNPNNIQLTCNSGSSTQTMGYSNITASTVDVHTGAGLGWVGLAIVY